MRLAGTRMYAACTASLWHLHSAQPADKSTGALGQLTTPAGAPARPQLEQVEHQQTVIGRQLHQLPESFGCSGEDLLEAI